MLQKGLHRLGSQCRGLRIRSVDGYSESPAWLASYVDTAAPNINQMREARHFFYNGAPQFLESASKLQTVDTNSRNLEVVFLGRSNVGKSSLLNAVLGQNICRTSGNPGRTKTMNFITVGGWDKYSRGLTLLDMPGYGRGSREEWGTEITKYLTKRRQ